jgi:hypothetical protein
LTANKYQATEEDFNHEQRPKFSPRTPNFLNIAQVRKFVMVCVVRGQKFEKFALLTAL